MNDVKIVMIMMRTRLSDGSVRDGSEGADFRSLTSSDADCTASPLLSAEEVIATPFSSLLAVRCGA